MQNIKKIQNQTLVKTLSYLSPFIRFEVLFFQYFLSTNDVYLLQFFIRDTKSSNGTFVNNHRLSKSGEESPWQEVCSGDIVQFGVDVQENSKNSKSEYTVSVTSNNSFVAGN